MLFDDNTFFDIKFPRPQYLGAKLDLLPWIDKFIPTDTKTVLDAFAGSQSVAFYFKQRGFKVITNDFLNTNNQIGKSLIENSDQIITAKDIDILFGDNQQKDNLVEMIFTGNFFELKESQFLDNFRSNINLLDNHSKKSLALTIMNRAMQRKIIMGHFAHTSAIKYANNKDRVKRNTSIARPIKDLFLELLPSYNSAVFDNGQENISYNQNILELLPNLKNIDLVYFDPPYTNSHSDYQSFYHLLETYTEYWKDKEFINGTNRYYPLRYSGFDKKTDILDSLNKLFELSEKIPNWLISWNDKSYPSVEDFGKIIKKYKNVRVETKTYQKAKGGRGSTEGSSEILFICTPKN